MKRLSIIIILFVVFATAPSRSMGAGGAKEAASTTERVEYVAERGLIVRPEEIYIDSYVAALDYRYPKPEGDFGITLYSGHRQVSSWGRRK